MYVVYLDALVNTLYKKEYFGFVESADFYVSKIYDFVEENIQTFSSRNTPLQLQNLGSNYIFYKSNQLTLWYIFFENKENNYLVTNIINSYSEEAKWL